MNLKIILLLVLISLIFISAVSAHSDDEVVSNLDEGPIGEPIIVLLHFTEITLAVISAILCYRVIKATGLMDVFKYFIIGLSASVVVVVISYLGGHVIEGYKALFHTHFGEAWRMIGEIILFTCIMVSFYKWQLLLKEPKDGGT